MKTNAVIIILLIINSCTPQKTLEQQVMEIYKDIPQYKERPYYTMQIGGGNCNFEIRVNDMSVWQHLRERGGISTNVPLNAYILESGIQEISIKIFPRKGETQLTKYANLSIEIRLYDDVDDPVLEYESILKYDLKMPEEGMPVTAYKNTFIAKVPYKIKAWRDSQDLTKVKDIEKKVLNFYQNYWQMWKNSDYNSIIELERRKEEVVAETMYLSKERILERAKNIKDIILEKEAILQPIDKYIMVYYAKNKVITLVLPNGDSLIHSIIKGSNDEGDEILSTTIQLHMPEGSDKLEVI